MRVERVMQEVYPGSTENLSNGYDYAISQAPADADLLWQIAAALYAIGSGRDTSYFSRITSYNVCYTKLLRIIFLLEIKMELNNEGLPTDNTSEQNPAVINAKPEKKQQLWLRSYNFV